MATIEIPDEYADRFEERAPEKGFDSMEEYVNYVLGQVVEKLERQQGDDESAYTEEEEEKVKDRLKGLGYLD